MGGRAWIIVGVAAAVVLAAAAAAYLTGFIREAGSGYAQAVTAYNVDRGEKPVVAVWGRNEAAATTLVVHTQGRETKRRVAIGKYFLVAFPYNDRADVADDGLLSGLRYEFVDGSGRDVTHQFAPW